MNIPVLIEENNLSKAWCKVLQHIIDNSGNEITPLVLTLSDFDEDNTIKNELNKDLAEHQLDSIDIVSETIFPQSLYLFNKSNRQELFRLYLENVLPRLKKIDKRNSAGTYFERLIAFGDSKKKSIRNNN
ncbi:hypothetical protein [Flavobacterium sp.]|uniref:hypothetical protein n=1 Tax=Flavobacterium sp. TaxID=239 RepID=UPI0035AED1F0